MAGAAGPLDRREQPRQILLPGAGPRHQSRALLARLRQHLRRVGDHRRGQAAAPRVFRERALSRARDGPVQVVIKKRGPRNEFREVWSVVVDPADAAVDRAAPPKLNVWAVMQNGAAARQGGPAADGRRLHRRRDGKVASRRAAHGGHAVRGVAVQGAPAGFQRLGRRYAGRRERRRAAFRRHLPALAAARRPTTLSARSATC